MKENSLKAKVNYLLAVHEDEPNCLFVLGLIYFSKNLLTKAVNYFKQALEGYPVTPWYPLVQLFLQQKFGCWGSLIEQMKGELAVSMCEPISWIR